MSDVDVVRLDLNNPVFQRDLLGLQKVERHAALDTLAKLRQLNWQQVYRTRVCIGKKSSASNRLPASRPFTACVSPRPAEP
jgi:hypothetical protein